MPNEKIIAKEFFGAELERLVRNFAANEAELTSPGYTEMQARTQFITPFFRALGWDVENAAGRPYREMEVLEEKGPGEGRPDYTFRIGGIAKFFVEAKAPHEDLSVERHILQAKRYAWSTKEVFAVILTDFEEFRFYDASLEPDTNHPHHGELIHLRYTEYLANLDKLLDFSRERVAAGSIEALLPRDKRALRYRKFVDDRFLEDMTRWREQLAKAVFKRNPNLDPPTLTEYVQRLLDRLIFIRVAEDRQILPKRSLSDRLDEWKAIGGRKPLLPMLNELFHQVNEDFNGDIFKPHPCEQIKLEDWALGDIIEDLYPPRSPYRFDAISADIFGAVYERYLGKTLRVRGKQVIVEDKPEVRKAGGVYYTPKYIVDYIVAHTVRKLIEGKTPKEIEKIKILDPACGSGSFLIGAFQQLIDYHVAYYEKHPKEARTHPLYPELMKNGNGTHRLSIHRKAKILHHNLFGVDLDPQAVEITMMNLYLKALEGERDLPHKQQLLPELKSNIICGNSVVGTDLEGNFAELLKRGGFDAVIGNPPYLSVKRGFLTRSDYEHIQQRFQTATRQWDIYEVFMERAFQLLRGGGFWSFIIPKPFLTNENMEPGRDFLLRTSSLRQIADCGTPFQQADVEAVVIVAEKTHPKPTNTIAIERLGSLGTKISSTETLQHVFHQLPFKAFALNVDNTAFSLLQKLRSGSVPLGELVSITRGIEAGKKDRCIAKRPSKRSRKLLRGEDVQRYSVYFPGLYVTPDTTDDAKFKSPEVYEVPKKILLRRVGAQLIAALDTQKFWTLNTVYSVKPKREAPLELLVAFLNSKLLNWWFKTSFVFEDRLFPYVRVSQAEQIPVRLPAERGKHAELCKKLEYLVEKATNLNADAASAKTDRQRQEISSHMREIQQTIDVFVYQLYGLSTGEIALVEQSFEKSGT